MRDSIRIKAAVLLAGGAVAILTACGSAKTDETTVQSSQEQESAAGQTETGNQSGTEAGENGTTLVYGSGDYTRINPAMDEHGEINILIFNGLTAHDGDNQVVPALAKDWTFDEDTCTYTFHLQEGVKWHDGEEFTADDVKFTIEAIMDLSLIHI